MDLQQGFVHITSFYQMYFYTDSAVFLYTDLPYYKSSLLLFYTIWTQAYIPVENYGTHSTSDFHMYYYAEYVSEYLCNFHHVNFAQN